MGKHMDPVPLPCGQQGVGGADGVGLAVGHGLQGAGAAEAVPGEYPLVIGQQDHVKGGQAGVLGQVAQAIAR